MVLKSMQKPWPSCRHDWAAIRRTGPGAKYKMTINDGQCAAFLLNPSPTPVTISPSAGWWNLEHPYDMMSGAAIRLVVDMSNLDTMTIMSPPGQSGMYLSPYYSDLAETWSIGGQVPAHYTDAKQLKQVLMLEPGKAK
jgi:hypothetical protein